MEVSLPTVALPPINLLTYHTLFCMRKYKLIFYYNENVVSNKYGFAEHLFDAEAIGEARRVVEFLIESKDEVVPVDRWNHYTITPLN